uniref:Uncharacterized protein n=1 Tax=Triticum urartu TaxID=4572 RepID=A0A8R7QQ40_TRIUA
RRLFSAAGHRSQWQLLPADQVRSHRTLIPSSCETICLLPLLKSEVLADPDRKNHAQPPHSAAPVSPTPAAPPILLVRTQAARINPTDLADSRAAGVPWVGRASDEEWPAFR